MGNICTARTEIDRRRSSRVSYSGSHVSSHYRIGTSGIIDKFELSLQSSMASEHQNDVLAKLQPLSVPFSARSRIETSQINSARDLSNSLSSSKIPFLIVSSPDIKNSSFYAILSPSQISFISVAQLLSLLQPEFPGTRISLTDCFLHSLDFTASPSDTKVGSLHKASLKIRPLSYFRDCQPFYLSCKPAVELTIRTSNPDLACVAEFTKTFYEDDSVRSIYEECVNVTGISLERLVLNELDSNSPICKYKKVGEVFSENCEVGLNLKEMRLDHVNFTVETITGGKISLTLPLCSDILEIKNAIQLETRINPDNQALYYMDRALQDDLTLEDYKISQDSVIKLFTKLNNLDNNPLYAIMDNETNTAVLEEESHGKDWRAALPGLCLEGFCLNTECKAYKQDRVVMNFGMTMFDLMVDQEICRCPICDERVTPISCAFNRCRYTISGLKIDTEGKVSRVVKQKWQSVDDQYRFYDPKDVTPGVEWVNLKLFTEVVDMLDTEKIPCAVCRKRLEDRNGQDLVRVESCGHMYHRRCAEIANQWAPVDCVLCFI